MPIDYSKYPPNWKTEIVPRILARDENSCKQCGLANGAEVTSLAMWVKDVTRYKVKRFWIVSETDVIRMSLFALPNETKTVKVVLTIAHLDHDETNFEVSDDRLAAMCQYCHLNYDASEKMRRIMAKGEQQRLDLTADQTGQVQP